MRYATGDRVKATIYGVDRAGVVTQNQASSIVIVLWDGAKAPTWQHEESLTPDHTPQAAARHYARRFGVALADRVRMLLTEYPDVTAPNFLSWEGESLTGADTSDKLRNLLAVLTN